MLRTVEEQAPKKQSINHFKSEDHLYENETLFIWAERTFISNSNGSFFEASHIRILINISRLNKRIPYWKIRIKNPTKRIANKSFYDASFFFFLCRIVSDKLSRENWCQNDIFNWIHIRKPNYFPHLQIKRNKKKFEQYEKKRRKKNQKKPFRSINVSLFIKLIKLVQSWQFDKWIDGQEYYTQKSETIKICLEKIYQMLNEL